ncbi:hypothetical protein [Sphaerisporangium corydalis]|uniref:ApeA N-terminal domain-containing protein n=1 Tax=Sphaerisporangium corydalis TaxID=1441875 RepID=A0ABV9EPE4_9ACTN|nr:hypothetical protein [Sphaerisporangium corydalis]
MWFNKRMASTDHLAVEFRTVFTHPGFAVAKEREPSVFDIPLAEGTMTVNVHGGDNDDPDRGPALCTVVVRRRIAGKPAQALQDCWKKQSPTEDALGGAVVISQLPRYLSDPLTEVAKASEEAVRRLLWLYRWRWGLDPHRQPQVKMISSDYSITDGQWRPTPEPDQRWSVGRPYLNQISLRHQESIAHLIDGGLQTPLGHELLAEAEELIYVAPRSCLLISVAAVEVGFKELVSRLVPDAAWLMKETQSPPLIKFLKDYLPLLPRQGRLSDNGDDETISESTIKQVQRAVKMRNDLAHRGHTPIDSEWLRKWLYVSADLLYLFELYAGHEWAEIHLLNAIHDGLLQ